MKQTIAYKVVQHHEDKMYSTWANFKVEEVKNSNFIVEYQLNKPTKPIYLNSMLFAFKTLDNAKAFVTFLSGEEHFATRFSILRCNVVPAKKQLKIIAYYISDISFFDFWNSRPGQYKSDLKYIPVGTICCSQITPLQKVS
jgi:hypothetical protein